MAQIRIPSWRTSFASVVAGLIVLVGGSVAAQVRSPGAGAAGAAGAARPGGREPYLSVADFGASGRDIRPDSDAIQRAINALPRPSMPGGRDPAGGVIVLPAGRYVLDKPLQIFNGVTLRGEGAGTVLHTRGDAPAVLLVSPFGHHYVASATIEELSIYTEKSAAIAVEPTVTNVVQCRFENLILSPGGCAIDLDPGQAQKCYTQNTVIRNVHILTPGGAALTMWGNANKVEQLNTEGGTRKGFKAEPAIVTIAGGGNDIRSCIIEANAPNPAVAFHLSGSFTWEQNWIELDPAEDGVAVVFQDVESAQIDYLHHILPWHKAKFLNCALVQIRLLNLNGELTSLDQVIELDEESHVRIDQVIARMDAGMLDDDRVSIGRVFNMTGRHQLELPLRSEGIDLMRTAAPDARGAAAAANAATGASGEWTAEWESQAGRIVGSMRLENHPDDDARTRLRVEIKENPAKRRLAVRKPVSAPPQLVGKRGVITWRIEGPAQTVVLYAGKEIPSRAMGTLTANPLPAPVRQGDLLEVIIPSDPGVYFISDVAIHPRP